MKSIEFEFTLNKIKYNFNISQTLKYIYITVRNNIYQTILKK